MFAAISHHTQSLIHLFFPRLCEGCRKPLLQAEVILCIGCEVHLSLTKYHNIADNETAVRLAGRFPFVHATSLAYFNQENILQHLLHRLKYNDKQNIGMYLGKRIGQSIKSLDWKLDGVIAVPLHKKKQVGRGFNQSSIIAEGVSKILEIPLVENAVERVKNTSSQTDKTRQERIDNVKDAFKVTNVKAIENKHLLLVDDVLTTGATLEACAKELLRSKGTQISIVTAGIAV